MALISPRQPGIEDRLQGLLAQREVQPTDAEYVSELRRRVKHFEESFGMPSDHIHQAIDAGELVEDQEVGRWIFTYTLLRSAEET